jgi:hypothetical protein
LQGLIEGFEAVHTEFDNNVPAAVGGVERVGANFPLGDITSALAAIGQLLGHPH